MALEIFVVPGFGITGILGIAGLLGGLSLSLVGSGATWEFTLRAFGQVVFSLLAAVIVSLFTLKYLPRLPFGRRLILETELPIDQGYVSAPESDLAWQGKAGHAVSPLRPAGIADIESHRVDVVSDGEFIETGAPIIVSRVDGNRIVVRRHTTQ